MDPQERGLAKIGRHDSPRMQSKLKEFEQGLRTKATRNCWLSHRFIYDEMVRDLPIASMKNTFQLMLIKGRYT